MRRGLRQPGLHCEGKAEQGLIDCRRGAGGPQGPRQGCSLWRLRHRRQRRLGQRRRRSRYGRVRRQLHSPLARASWMRTLWRLRSTPDHRRWWRLQRLACALVEDRTAKARGRNRPDDHGLSLPAGHLEMEQDRASPLLPYHAELARSPANEPPGDRPTDRKRDEHTTGPKPSW